MKFVFNERVADIKIPNNEIKNVTQDQDIHAPKQKRMVKKSLVLVLLSEKQIAY